GATQVLDRQGPLPDHDRRVLARDVSVVREADVAGAASDKVVAGPERIDVAFTAALEELHHPGDIPGIRAPPDRLIRELLGLVGHPLHPQTLPADAQLVSRLQRPLLQPEEDAVRRAGVL